MLDNRNLRSKGKPFEERQCHEGNIPRFPYFRGDIRDRANATYRSAYRAVIDVDGMAIATLAESAGADSAAIGRWHDYCTDVVICHAARVVLFNKPITLVSALVDQGAPPL